MAGHKGDPYYDIFLRYEMWLETIGKDRILDHRTINRNT